MKEEFLDTIFQHQAIIHKVCRLYRDTPEDREDLFQEIVYQLWRSYPSFSGRSKISSWMYRVALNTAIAAFRKPRLPTTGLNGIPETDGGNDPGNPQLEQLFAAIKKLDAPDKALISLYLDDMPYAEIAAITGISENYVGVRLNRIKQKLKIFINKP